MPARGDQAIGTPTTGRVFRLGWPPWQPPSTDGLAAIVTPGGSTGWADGLLAREPDGLVVWAATGGEPAIEGLARLHYPGVRAVSLTLARNDPRRVRVALELALELAKKRQVAACLTAWHRPTPPPEVVRIPHLVTVQRDGAVTDEVVWELAPVAVARDWLGGPLPDQPFFEAHLETLLRLRGAARQGRLPATGAAADLADLLGDRDLSIKLVYTKAERFRAVLSTRPDPIPTPR